jgi:hypothetical protein
MFDTDPVPSSFRGPYQYVAGTRAESRRSGAASVKPRARAAVDSAPVVDMLLAVGPKLFMRNIPQDPRVIRRYNAPIKPPVNRSIENLTSQNP